MGPDEYIRGHKECHDAYFQMPWPVSRKPGGAIECPQCSELNTIKSSFCSSCGKELRGQG